MTGADDNFTTAAQAIRHLRSLANKNNAREMTRFFKCGEGEYGHGDRFLGINTPEVRATVKRCRILGLKDIERLLASPWHEVRTTGGLTLVDKFEKLCSSRLLHDPQAIAARDKIAEFYLAHSAAFNNWDLVDLTVYKILGRWLMSPSFHTDEERLATVDTLAASDNLWEQRMAMICTMEPLRQGDASFTLRYAAMLVDHPHDLIHKAVGWMLREMGKRVSPDLLRQFLAGHAATIPRTALRYAIEHLSPEERKYWLDYKSQVNQ